MTFKQSQKNTIFIAVFLAIVALSFVLEYQNKTQTVNSKTIQFWHYWSAAEKEPIDDLVAKFNKENHSFKVQALSISMPRKKILTAIIGDVAPDLVHLDNDMVTDFALRNALSDISLDHFAQEEFIKVFIDALKFSKQMAMPYMGGAEAMHLNTKLLQKYQIEIPQSLEDIENAFTKSFDKEKYPLFLPSWPSWMGEIITLYFGGSWIDPNGNPSANSQANIEAWEWIEKNFISKIPEDKILSFTEGFGAYQSPDNPFYSGKIGIEINGIWEKNLASIYSPDLEIKIAPFPGKIKNATLARVDALAIPANAKNKNEALEFLQWLLKQENVEYIALAQKKLTPYKTNSEIFFEKHQNPFIKTFLELANSPNAKFFPQVKYANRYRKEIRNAYDKVIRKQLSAKQALEELQLIAIKISKT